MIKNFISKLIQSFQFGEDQAPEEETISNIETGIAFKGAKLWVLILAIFVASLGLNTNSTAVIIGAMLISPLMGPILGMGLSVGIQDFTMLKKAFKNYLVATIFSVITATLYFLITPFDEVQSELLARTSPTIYDVLIALCGGLAGIIGLSSRSQRTGNVIPGVAIATALMPPLCTVGFSLATANWMYALGALYLYIINTVFISLATCIGVAFIFKFTKRTALNKPNERKFKYVLIAIGVFVIIPSIIVTFNMVRRSIFETNAHKFCKEATEVGGAHLIGNEIDAQNRTIKLVFMGEVIDSAAIRDLQSKLPAYRLENASLSIIQGTQGIDEETVRSIVENSKNNSVATSQMLEALQAELEQYHSIENQSEQILREISIDHPSITAISLAQGKKTTYAEDSTTSRIVIVTYKADAKIGEDEHQKLTTLLKAKLNKEEVLVVQE